MYHTLLSTVRKRNFMMQLKTLGLSAAAQVVSDSDSEVEISIDSESVAVTNEAQTEQQLFTDPELESMFSKLAIT